MVANKFLEEIDLDDEVRKETVAMCKHFHESVRLMSAEFYDILRRRNYVTPTSYLELILTFKKLLNKKRDEIQLMKNRYLTGLEKLDFAASQGSVMQLELQNMQPELIKTSAETEKLMIKIEQDTVEVEAKKEVLLHSLSYIVFFVFFASFVLHLQCFQFGVKELWSDGKGRGLSELVGWVVAMVAGVCSREAGGQLRLWSDWKI